MCNAKEHLFINDKTRKVNKMINKHNVGELVDVPLPNDTDIHKHEFTGELIEVNEFRQVGTVLASDGNCFTFELNRLTLAEN